MEEIIIYCLHVRKLFSKSRKKIMKPEGRINNKVCLKLIDPDAPASLFNSV